MTKNLKILLIILGVVVAVGFVVLAFQSPEPVEEVVEIEELEFACGTDTVSDIDGNDYQTVQLGNQCWMAENLKTTTYRDGTNIPEITDNTDWANDTDGARAAYNNDSDNVTTYGYLYNWHAVDNTSELCPTGWSVPSHSNFTELEQWVCNEANNDNCDTEFPYDTATTGFQGTDEGDRIKSEDTRNWCNSSPCATHGFSALPGGYRFTIGNFYYLGSFARFWSSSEDGSVAWGRYLYPSFSTVNRDTYSQVYGFSVRCLRD